MKRSTIPTIVILTLVVSCYASPGLAPSPGRSASFPGYAQAARTADPTVPANWLAQKICLDGNGNVAGIDPYSSSDAFGDACPAGYSIRNLRESDQVPYYKYYNPISGNTSLSRYRYTYAYETRSATGETVYVMDRQFQPSNVADTWYIDQSYYPGSTHWDTYGIHSGWVSNATTRDNTGLNQTFYGNLSGSTTPYNGWVDFPTAYLQRINASPQPQSVYVPVHGVYWEQSGLPWPTPGQSISQSNVDTQSVWALIPRYTFDSGKRMNTLAAYHQSKPRPADTNPDQGHMEAWLFTVPYGPTRWEVWSAATCLASSCSSAIQSSCRTHTATMTFPYKGANYRYYRTNCVDWEQGTTRASSGSTVPTLPVPQANLLTNFHFSNDPVLTTNGATGWQVGSSLNLTQLESNAPGDTRDGRYSGVRYVKLSCRSICSAASSLSQVIDRRSSGTYSIGVEAETEASTGSIQVSLSQIDAHGNVIGSPSVVRQTIDSLGDGSNCVSHPRVENCALYVGKRARLDALPATAQLRVTVQLLTAGVNVDITDVFLSQL